MSGRAADTKASMPLSLDGQEASCKIRHYPGPPQSPSSMDLVFPHTFVPWFRSVAPHIHAHRGKTFVIGFSGELIAAGKLSVFAQDLALMQAMGIRLVLTHGFRPQVEEQLRAKGHVSQFSHGMRITDALALDCAQEAAGQLRYEIEAAFSQGLPNTPMAGAAVRVISGNFVTARPVGIVDGIDFQHTGLVRKIDAVAIRQIIDAGSMVLLSPFGFSPTGEAFNLSMEDLATSAAVELQADKLIFVTEVRGIPQDPGQAGDPAFEIDKELALKDAKKTLGGPAGPDPTHRYSLLPATCRSRPARLGWSAWHILSYAVDGGLLMEVFTHDGCGHHDRGRKAGKACEKPVPTILAAYCS